MPGTTGFLMRFFLIHTSKIFLQDFATKIVPTTYLIWNKNMQIKSDVVSRIFFLNETKHYGVV